MKTYTLTVEVDIDTLIASYTASSSGEADEAGGDDSIQQYDLPSVEEIIEFEMGWVSSSGIYVKEVKEIQQ